MTAIIETRTLSKKYGHALAVSEASFTIEPGEVVGFVGLNGAGKSTTINMLLGFQNPTAGEVRLFGHRVTPVNAHKSHARIGFATGDMSLFDDMTGEQYLAFVARAYKQKFHTPMFDSLVERFKPQLKKKISTLSRGNRQKIALVAAFMCEPELVILDEPSSGLDPLMQQAFLDLVREESARGVTIFMSSHYLAEVADVCTRILLIKNGVLTKDIPTSELELTSGKWVRVVTKQKVMPPKSADAVKREKNGDDYVLEFIYKDKALRLQEWLGTLPNLRDMTVSDHNPEAAFEELYEETDQKEEGVQNV